jgi:hypothetical protein
MQAPLASNAGPPSATARPRRNRSVADAIPLLVVLPSRSDTGGGGARSALPRCPGGSSRQRTRREARGGCRHRPCRRRQPRAVVVFGASAVLRRLILAPSRLPLGPRCGLANASPDRGLAGRPRMPLPARGVGRSSFHGAALTVGTHTARSCHSVLLLLGQPSAASGTASSDRRPAADPPRSTRLRLSRAGRRGAQGLHSTPIRSPQGE